MSDTHRLLPLAIAALLAALLLAIEPAAAQETESGYLNLLAYLGASPVPDGTDIRVAITEATVSGTQPQYLPSGKPVNDVSGFGTPASNHASGVSSHLYQGASIANGVTDIDAYYADHWIAREPNPLGLPPPDPNLSVLQAVSPFAPRVFEFSGIAGGMIQVANGSWIGNCSAATDSECVDMLRRADLVVERDDVVMTMGVNNGLATPVPDVLANSYNVLGVGLIGTSASQGPSTLDVPGRSKPDIVVAGTSFSSISTPVVGATAALLLDAALRLGVGDLDADNPEAIKSILMAGASKDVGWTRFDNGSYFEPLDRNNGAGRLNILDSYRILEGGQEEGLASLSPINNADSWGWDFDTLAAGNQELYYFNVPSGQLAPELSILTTWHRQVTASGFDLDGNVTWDVALADLNLELWRADAAGNLLTLLDSSVSGIDNVEHIYQTDLGAGRYAWRLSYDGADVGDWDFGIAWRGALAAVPVPEPGSLLLWTLAGGLLALARPRRSRR